MTPLEWPWVAWTAVAWLFFGLVPLLINRGFAALYPAHRIHAAKRDAAGFRSRDGRLLAFVLVQMVNATLLGTCLWLGMVLQRAGIGQIRMDPLHGAAWVLVVPEIVLVLLVFDAQFFWIHWLAHRHTRLYKWFHQDHHDDRFPDAWSALYQHPVDFVVTTASSMAWCVVLPVHATSWFLTLLIANYINIAGHCGVEMTHRRAALITPNGWASTLDPMRRSVAALVNAVTHHDLHHQRYRVNFSLYFTHWDRIMGTLATDTDAVYRLAAGLPPDRGASSSAVPSGTSHPG